MSMFKLTLSDGHYFYIDMFNGKYNFWTWETKGKSYKTFKGLVKKLMYICDITHSFDSELVLLKWENVR